MSKNQKKKSSPVLLLLFIAAAIFIYYYKHDPQFKTKVDLTANQTIEKINGWIGSDVIPSIPQETKSHTPSLPEKKQPESKTASQPAVPQKDDIPPDVIILSDNLAFPVCAAAKHAKDHEIRNYKYYSICYREPYEQAEWSAYCLDESELSKKAGRTDDFRPDDAISTGSATLADYRGSGYDRGHLSPAADFAFSTEAMSETFYMSNMSPQAGAFNRGIWKDLESNVRVWAKKFGKVYVISGPVLDESPEDYATIGSNKVSVPKYYYKVLMAPLYKNQADRDNPYECTSITGIAFILPNKKCDDSYFNYAVTIDEVENRTGLNFFESLDDRTEAALESTFNVDLWK